MICGVDGAIVGGGGIVGAYLDVDDEEEAAAAVGATEPGAAASRSALSFALRIDRSSSVSFRRSDRGLSTLVVDDFESATFALDDDLCGVLVSRSLRSFSFDTYPLSCRYEYDECGV